MTERWDFAKVSCDHGRVPMPVYQRTITQAASCRSQWSALSNLHLLSMYSMTHAVPSAYIFSTAYIFSSGSIMSRRSPLSITCEALLRA